LKKLLIILNYVGKNGNPEMDIVNISGLFVSLVNTSLSKSGEKPLVESFLGVSSVESVENCLTLRPGEAVLAD
jgi:hypothetical protein